MTDPDKLEAALELLYGHCADKGEMAIVMDAARAHLAYLKSQTASISWNTRAPQKTEQIFIGKGGGNE